MQKTNKQEYISGVKKFASIFTNAAKLAEVEIGDLKKTGDTTYNFNGEYGIENEAWIGYKYILDNLKINKSCTGTNYSECTPRYKDLDGNDVNDWGSPYLHYILSDGMTLLLTASSYPLGDQWLVDINGKKGPNVICKDAFPFWFYGDKFDYLNNYNINDIGEDCFSYILKYNNMDYLDE